MKHARALFMFTIALAAPPALASNPLLFEWSGTDSNSEPFSVALTVTDVQSSDTNYEFIDFGDPSQVEVYTEELGHDQIITNVTSTTLGGAFTYPNTTTTDPFGYLFAFENNGLTYLSLAVGADDSDIGLTFNGNTLQYIEFSGDLPFAWVDPTTASSLSDLFPVGTYDVTGAFGFLAWDSGNGTEYPSPTTLTISVIPEPSSIALLALGGLALLRRR